MHAVQGALAVRRERQKRMQRRLSDKRPHQRNSDVSQLPSHDVESGKGKKPKQGTSMTSFYIGVIFILLGFLLIFSSMVPANVVNADWSKLLGIGVAFLIVGLLMVMVNRILSAQEDEELKSYVSHRLARTRSGHVLCQSRNQSLDFTKLAPPGRSSPRSSRRSSNRDRPGSNRSINRSPSIKQNSPKASFKYSSSKAIERSSSSDRRSFKKHSPNQNILTTARPVTSSNITRSQSQRIKSNHNHETNNSSITRSSTKDRFRSRATSFKNGDLPTVLIKLTDDKSNSSSIVLLTGQGIGSNSKISYANKESELPLVHSSSSAHAYRNGSKHNSFDHNSFDCVNDDQDDCLKYTEKDSLLPKNGTSRISSSSLSNHARKPSKKKAKDEISVSANPMCIVSTGDKISEDDKTQIDRENESNPKHSVNKFNSTRTLSSAPKSRTTSES